MVGGTELLWFPLLFFLASFTFVDTIPDLILRPRLSGRDMHVGSVMFAYIFGPLLFGWYGLFLGPMLLVLLIQFGRIVLPELLAGERISPTVVDRTAHGTESPRPGGREQVSVSNSNEASDETRSAGTAERPEEAEPEDDRQTAKKRSMGTAGPRDPEESTPASESSDSDGTGQSTDDESRAEKPTEPKHSDEPTDETD